MVRSREGATAVVVSLLAALVATFSLAPALPDLTAQAVLVLGVLLVAAAGNARAAHHVPFAARAHVLLHRRRAGAVPLVLSGRSTDVVHHPLRPRAPGPA